MVGCIGLYGGSYATGYEDILIGLEFRCVAFSEAHKSVLSLVKLKHYGRSFSESLPVVWAACTTFSQMNILRLQNKMFAC